MKPQPLPVLADWFSGRLQCAPTKILRATASLFASIILAASMPVLALDALEELDALNAQVEDLMDESRYDEALPLANKALKIAQDQFPSGDLRLVGELNHLGLAFQAKENYTAARPIFEKALEITQQALGAEHENTVSCLNNLASLFYFQGDYERARPLYERALSIQEKAGAEGASLKIMINLAGLLELQGEHDRSALLYERALPIAEKDPNVDPDDLAACLNSVALSRERVHKTDEAISLLQQALKVRERASAGSEMYVVEALNNLASSYRRHFILGACKDPKDLTEARRLFDRALELAKKTVGPDHLEVATILNNIGDIAFANADMPHAQANFLQAADIIRLHAEKVLPTLPMAEQKAFIAYRMPMEISLLLTTCKSGEALSAAYNRVMLWKGLLIESMRRESRINKLLQDPSAKVQAEKLRELRSQLASWYMTAGNAPYQEWKAKGDELTAEKEKIEQSLARTFATGAIGDPIAGGGLKEVCATLAPGEALVDIYQFRLGGSATEQFDHCAAIIISAGQPDKPVMVDLGLESEIRKAITAWNEEVYASQDGSAELAAVTKMLWLPIQKNLPASASRIWLCPDGELARVPWHLLPGPSSKYLFSQIDSVRELLSLAKSTELAQAPATCLLAGDVDFDAIEGGRPTRAAEAGMIVRRLPGTLVEMNEIKALAEKEHFAITEFSGAAATRKAVLGALPRSNWVHLATHGFFINEKLINTIYGNTVAPQSETGIQGGSIKIVPKNRAAIRQRNPMVESGLLLAGSNLRDQITGLNPGLLTAEELVGTDLSSCRLLTLSACDTGRGSMITGQGVMGLRAALLAAGAHSLLISLWKVPDKPTVKLMTEFYTSLWSRHLPPAEALKRAQKTFTDLPPGQKDHLPLAWAAWVLVGRGW